MPPEKTFEIKWGLGFVPQSRSPIKLYHVVIDGRTVATFATEEFARGYILNRFGHVPIGKK